MTTCNNYTKLCTLTYTPARAHLNARTKLGAQLRRSRSSKALYVSAGGQKQKAGKSNALSVRASDMDYNELKTGDLIVVTEVPPFVKTSEAMPSLRPGNVVSLGEPGRVIDRRPMKTWVVRFSNGTYLIDEKYFKPSEE